MGDDGHPLVELGGSEEQVSSRSSSAQQSAGRSGWQVSSPSQAPPPSCRSPHHTLFSVSRPGDLVFLPCFPHSWVILAPGSQTLFSGGIWAGSHRLGRREAGSAGMRPTRRAESRRSSGVLALPHPPTCAISLLRWKGRSLSLQQLIRPFLGPAPAPACQSHALGEPQARRCGAKRKGSAGAHLNSGCCPAAG